jgi:hypothetical protein
MARTKPRAVKHPQQVFTGKPRRIIRTKTVKESLSAIKPGTAKKHVDTGQGQWHYARFVISRN